MSEGASDPLIGTPVLGGYVITSILGAGGMGSVYLAEHKRIGRKVAVKVLHPHMTSNRDIVARFLAEARAASALDHPNIIEVVDAATLDDGRDYIALEFLKGEALDDYLKARKQLDLDTALHILVQTCCGLEAAHHRGIIHRDLKPANLFVAPTELDPLRTKVLDFGIAKLTDTVMAGGVETGTNAIAGTPGYMPPEQARGMRDVDHRADLYSLGAVAYRMITGRLPYTGDSLGEIIYQQLAAPPPDVRQLRPDLPDAWAHAIMSCLGSEPDMRPPSARHFALAIASATPGGVELLRRAAPLFFSDPWIERNHALVNKLPAPPPHAASVVEGGTSTYGPQHDERSPATTLSSAAGYVLPTAAPPSRRRWPTLLAAGGASAAAIGGIIAVVGSTMNTDGGQQAAAVVDAAVRHQPDAEAIAVASSPDASAIVTDVSPKAAASNQIVIEVKVSPKNAFIELDGVTTRSPLKLKRGSKHVLVVSRRGYAPYRKDITASVSGTIPIKLLRERASDRKPPAEKKPPPSKKPDPEPKTGPLSTTLDDVKKKPSVGPTTNEL